MNRMGPEAGGSPVDNQNQENNQQQKIKLEEAKKERWWIRLFGDRTQNSNLPADRIAERREADINEIEHPRDINELVNLIDRMDSGQYRYRMLEQRYGKGLIGKCKSWLEQQEFEANPNGEVKQNWWATLAKKGLNIVTDRRVLGGAAGLVVASVLSGGAVPAAAAMGFVGTISGRSVGELAQSLWGKENGLRRDLARHDFENFAQLQKIAGEIRRANSDEERINKVNELVSLYYNTSKNVTDNESELVKEKEHWDKVNNWLTTAGSLIGVTYGVLGQWQDAMQHGVEKVKMYEFDGLKDAHSIEQINGKYVYHLRDVYGNITGTHDLGGIPTQEMLNNFTIKEFVNEAAKTEALKNVAWETAKGLLVTLGTGLSGFLGKPSVESISTDSKEMKQVGEKLEKSIPEAPKIPENERIVPGQTWTFDFIGKLGRLGDGAMYENIMDLNRLELSPSVNLPFGEYRVREVKGDDVEIELVNPMQPNSVYVDNLGNNCIVTISKKDLTANASKDIKNQEMPYDGVYTQLAKFYQKPNPEKSDIWRFQGNVVNSLFYAGQTTDISGANRWRIESFDNNWANLEPLEDNRNVRRAGVQPVRVHVAELLKFGETVRTKKEVDEDRSQLSAKGINPESIGEHYFDIPTGSRDINTDRPITRGSYKLTNINLKEGTAKLELVNPKNGKAEVAVVSISSLLSWKEISSIAEPKDVDKDKDKKGNDLLEKFRDELQKMGIVDDSSRNNIVVGKNFHIDNKEYKLGRLDPDNQDLIFYEIRKRVVGKGKNKKTIVEVDTSTAEKIKVDNIKNRNIYYPIS